MPASDNKLALMPSNLTFSFYYSNIFFRYIIFIIISLVDKSSKTTKSVKIEANPFKMPPDTDIFMLREKEKQQKLIV
jgi:hypothetical protein